MLQTKILQKSMQPVASVAKRFVPKAGANWPRVLPSLEGQSIAAETQPYIDPAHFEPMNSWSSEKKWKSRKENPFLMTWVPGKARHNVMNLTHGEGVYIFDDQGNKYFDWTSQAVCSNFGHSVPKEIVEATAAQMESLPFVYGGIGVPEMRVRMNQLMNEILPGDLTPALFPSSGSEANEAGIMMARRYTGKKKVLSWYRAYHGATAHASAATGDFRKWYGADDVPGFVKAFSPFPLFFRHGGSHATDEESVQAALNMLEEQILNEGPDEIASIMLESVIGAGGCLVYPDGYMQGLRALCDKYGILMHCDEVMVGFGRTGKLFGFQNYEGVQPDIITCAKGISAGAIPLSMVAVGEKIMDFFEDKPVGYGSTYQAHPVAMATGYESTKYLIKENIVGQVQEKAPLFEECMERIASDHPCIKQYRSVGMFGCFDVMNVDGSIPKLQHEGASRPLLKYKEAFKKNGMVGLHRYPHIHCAPPITTTEDEILDGFDRLDRSITVLDEELGFI